MVVYPRLVELYDDIQECCLLSVQTREAHCMALEGPSGAGKSWMIRNFIREYPRCEHPHHTEVPVFYAEIPLPATIKDTASKMLEALGDPGFEKGTLGGMTRRLVGLLGSCQVQLVVLDDIHHLIAADTDRVLETVAGWLKTLIKTTRIPFVVIGVEGRVTRVLKSSAELSRLFAVREKLEPFSWDASKPETLETLDSFVDRIEKLIGVEFSPELPREEWLARLHYATDGIVSWLMEMLLAAKLRSPRSAEGCSTVLTRDSLERAFRKRMSHVVEHKVNPFLEQHGPRWVPPPRAVLGHSPARSSGRATPEALLEAKDALGRRRRKRDVS